MEYIHVEGSQPVRPLEFDATTSKTVVYLRKNIERASREVDGRTYEVWEYDEATVPYDDFAAIASAIVSDNKADIADNRDGIIETYEATESNATDVSDLREAVMEIYELITEE